VALSNPFHSHRVKRFLEGTAQRCFTIDTKEFVSVLKIQHKGRLMREAT
jgi:hypothetical protein